MTLLQSDEGELHGASDVYDTSMVGAGLRHLLPRLLQLMHRKDVAVRQLALELLAEFLKQVGAASTAGRALWAWPGLDAS